MELAPRILSPTIMVTPAPTTVRRQEKRKEQVSPGMSPSRSSHRRRVTDPTKKIAISSTQSKSPKRRRSKSSIRSTIEEAQRFILSFGSEASFQVSNYDLRPRRYRFVDANTLSPYKLHNSLPTSDLPTSNPLYSPGKRLRRNTFSPEKRRRISYSPSKKSRKEEEDWTRTGTIVYIMTGSVNVFSGTVITITVAIAAICNFFLVHLNFSMHLAHPPHPCHLFQANRVTHLTPLMK